MTIPNLSDLENLALQAGKILFEGYEKHHLVKYKGMIDLVTEVDHASEKYLLNEINRKFPGHSFLAEESGSSEIQSEHRWIIDPLDGTVNYAHGVPIFCVSIAYAYQNQVLLGAVYDPMRNELFKAERGKGSWLNERRLLVSNASELQKSLMVTGFPYDAWAGNSKNFEYYAKLGMLTQGVRRLGSAALDLCYIAAGRLDGYWEISLSAWDVAAAGLIAEEAGALVTNIQGNTNYLQSPFSIIAANPTLHAKLSAELH